MKRRKESLVSRSRWIISPTGPRVAAPWTPSRFARCSLIANSRGIAL